MHIMSTANVKVVNELLRAAKCATERPRLQLQRKAFAFRCRFSALLQFLNAACLRIGNILAVATTRIGRIRQVVSGT